MKPQDPQFVAASQATGLNISLLYQPHNSPDLNFLDLGFLSSIHSLQHTKAPQNVEDLTTAVTDSYNKQHFSKIKNIFLTLQMVMELCILHDGENDYKMPHTNKARLEREGRLPVYIQFSEQLLGALHNVATYKTKRLSKNTCYKQIHI